MLLVLTCPQCGGYDWTKVRDDHDHWVCLDCHCHVAPEAMGTAVKQTPILMRIRRHDPMEVEVVTINGKEYNMSEVMACHDFLEERYFIEDVQRAIEEIISANLGDDPEYITWLESKTPRIIHDALNMKDEWDQWQAETMGSTGANYVDYATNLITELYGKEVKAQ